MSIGGFSWPPPHTPYNSIDHDQFNAVKGNSIRGNVLANDHLESVPAEVIPFGHFSASGQSVWLEANGDFLYEPDPDFHGRDSFWYEIKGINDYAAMVKITIINSNDAGVFVDPRDGEEYPWVRLKNGIRWMAENLNYAMENSWAHEQMNSENLTYGRFYT